MNEDTTLDINVEDIEAPRPTKTLAPMDDTVVYRLVEHESVGGILLPGDDMARLVVVAVGPGKWLADGSRDVPDFGPGDEIVRWPGGKLIKSTHYGPEPLYLCRISDVAAVVHTEQPNLILVP